jgi:hypothetical protein
MPQRPLIRYRLPLPSRFHAPLRKPRGCADQAALRMLRRLQDTLDAPRGRQIGSIGITVLPGGRIKVVHDGGFGNEVGTTNDVNSDQIDELLVNFLRDLSRELSAKSS